VDRGVVGGEASTGARACHVGSKWRLQHHILSANDTEKGRTGNVGSKQAVGEGVSRGEGMS
jgi:hypothetical protein